MAELTDIDGVGSKTAGTLSSAGFETPEDITDADEDQLASAIEDKPLSAQTLIERAEAEATDIEDTGDVELLFEDVDRIRLLHLLGATSDQLVRAAGDDETFEGLADFAENVMKTAYPYEGKRTFRVTIDEAALHELHEALRSRRNQFPFPPEQEHIEALLDAVEDKRDGLF